MTLVKRAGSSVAVSRDSYEKTKDSQASTSKSKLKSKGPSIKEGGYAPDTIEDMKRYAAAGDAGSQAKLTAMGVPYAAIQSQQVAGRRAVKAGDTSEVYGSSLGPQVGERLLPPQSQGGGGIIRAMHQGQELSPSFDFKARDEQIRAGTNINFERKAQQRALERQDASIRAQGGKVITTARRDGKIEALIVQDKQGNIKQDFVLGEGEPLQINSKVLQHYDSRELKTVTPQASTPMARTIIDGKLAAGRPQTRKERIGGMSVITSEEVGGKVGEYSRVMGVDTGSQSIDFGEGMSLTGFTDFLNKPVFGGVEKVRKGGLMKFGPSGFNIGSNLPEKIKGFNLMPAEAAPKIYQPGTMFYYQQPSSAFTSTSVTSTSNTTKGIVPPAPADNPLDYGKLFGGRYIPVLGAPVHELAKAYYYSRKEGKPDSTLGIPDTGGMGYGEAFKTYIQASPSVASKILRVERDEADNGAQFR